MNAVPLDELGESDADQRQLKRSVTTSHLRSGTEESPGSRRGDEQGSDQMAEEKNAAIARMKKNRTLPHLRPPMPSILSPGASPFPSSGIAPVSPRRTGGGLRQATGPTSLSLNNLPVNSAPTGPSMLSPRSRVMSVYASSSQPSSPTTTPSPSSPSSPSSSPLQSPRRNRASSHSAPHAPIASIFPQRSISSSPDSYQAPSGTGSSIPSPLSRISSRKPSKQGKDEQKKKKKDEKEKRDGSKRRPNPKGKGHFRRPSTIVDTGHDVFGMSLEEIMQQQRRDHPLLQVPIVLLNCAHAIILLEGHRTEGIFRCVISCYLPPHAIFSDKASTPITGYRGMRKT